ncbi:MAG TPA: hypothetical protein VGA37_06680 [Gemmatimonadales bacterium]
MRNPIVLFLAACICGVAWVTLTFIADLHTGWTHVPLVLAVALVVVGIVEADARRDAGGRSNTP